MVDVRWSIEEYALTIGDDDIRYVGDIAADGLFVPAVDGPNVERSGSRNSVGDVWVVATSPPDAADGDGLTGRATSDDGYAVLLADTAIKHLDRFEIAPRRLLQVDLASHEIMREIPWPGGEERTGASMMFSPPGGLLYLFRRRDRFQRRPQRGAWLLHVSDPVQNRRLMGIARIHLAERDVDFYTLGPDEPLSSFSLAPDRRKDLRGPQAHRPLRDLDLRPRRAPRRAARGLRRAPPHVAGGEHQRPGPLRPPGRRHHRPARGVDLPLTAHHQPRRRHDQPLPGAEPGTVTGIDSTRRNRLLATVRD